MSVPSILEFAHDLVRAVVVPGALALDATTGNGHDTEFLAEIVGPSGRVLGMDVQREAILSTQTRLRAVGLRERVRLFQEGHERVADVVRQWLDRPLTAAMYNLGYLPGSDRSVITRPDTTLESLQQVIRLLAPGGIVTIVTYAGHRGGEDEAHVVSEWSRALPTQTFDVARYEMLNRSAHSPILIAVSSVDDHP